MPYTSRSARVNWAWSILETDCNSVLRPAGFQPLKHKYPAWARPTLTPPGQRGTQPWNHSYNNLLSTYSSKWYHSQRPAPTMPFTITGPEEISLLVHRPPNSTPSLSRFEYCQYYTVHEKWSFKDSSPMFIFKLNNRKTVHAKSAFNVDWPTIVVCKYAVLQPPGITKIKVWWEAKVWTPSVLSVLYIL